jgi:hypothetical protein
MANVKNWKVDQASNFLFTIQYKDPNGNPIDLTSFDVRMDIKSTPGSKKILASCTIGDGIEVIPEIGRIDINLSAEKTKLIAYPKSAYDLVIESPSGIITRLLEGYLEVSRAVTDIVN